MATILCFLAGCAAPPPPAPIDPAVHRRCINEMYAERATRGRGAPSWQIYDYCVKRSATRTTFEPPKAKEFDITARGGSVRSARSGT